jgi:hypothetical protein
MTDPNPASLQPASPSVVPGWYPDAGSGRTRWWDGTKWTENYHQASVVATNGFATASLVLGIIGFVLMGIPLFIGWFLGGIPDVLAVIFGILGISQSNRLGGVGKTSAIVGLVLGGVSLLSVFVGAGSIW